MAGRLMGVRMPRRIGPVSVMDSWQWLRRSRLPDVSGKGRGGAQYWGRGAPARFQVIWLGQDQGFSERMKRRHVVAHAC